MSIADKLTASKNGLDSLLAYANQTTGQSDTDLGAAIRTLCNGFGQGGGGSVCRIVDVNITEYHSFNEITNVVYEYSSLLNLGSSYSVVIIVDNNDLTKNRAGLGGCLCVYKTLKQFGGYSVRVVNGAISVNGYAYGIDVYAGSTIHFYIFDL